MTRFYAAEIDIYTPLGQIDAGAPAQADTLRASDLGYRTLPSDPSGVLAYPPYLSQAFMIDRQINLDPSNSAVAASWGSMELANADGSYTYIAADWNSDGRRVSILYGEKGYDQIRGIEIDPPYHALQPTFVGFSTPWFLSDTALSVPIRDATYWLERPYQTALYGGTGGLDGTSSLTGQAIPKARGGTASNPIRNVTPVLVDPVNQIYQYNDGPGTVVTLYEGGSAVYVSQGDAADLTVGEPSAGHYRTCNALGLFQLGNAPTAAAITADVTGAFPGGVAASTVATIAKNIMLLDMGLPAEYFDAGGFASADRTYPYVAGYYFSSDTIVQGVDAVDQVLTGLGAKLVPLRNGQLSIFVLRELSTATAAVMTIDPSNAVSVTPVPLPATLDPPPYRWRVGYNHNYTVQSTGVLASATASQSAFVQTADRYATFSSSVVLASYRRPNDVDPIVGGLLSQSDAQAAADDFGELWSSVRRRLYDVVMPVSVGASLEIMDAVFIVWPMENLANGRIGQIVGEQYRSADATVTYRVLMNGGPGVAQPAVSISAGVLSGVATPSLSISAGVLTES